MRRRRKVTKKTHRRYGPNTRIPNDSGDGYSTNKTRETQAEPNWFDQPLGTVLLVTKCPLEITAKVPGMTFSRAIPHVYLYHESYVPAGTPVMFLGLERHDAPAAQKYGRVTRVMVAMYLLDNVKVAIDFKDLVSADEYKEEP